ncbi:MAG: glycerate kinase [Bacteroidota bacterium]
MFKLIIAPDSFKDALSAFDVASAIGEGIRQTSIPVELLLLPMGDGGEGFSDLFTHYHKSQTIPLTVQDPLGRPVEAQYALSEDGQIACIEMAQASGLELLAHTERSCMFTSTYGTGEMIHDALDKGVQEIIIGLGGSATCDAGVGMANALGYRFYDDHGAPMQPVGKDLKDIAQINIQNVHPRLPHVKVYVASDVENPLYGPSGAAHVFGPQKGASPAEVLHLDQGLQHMDTLLSRLVDQLVGQVPGAGAAGGMGAGCMSFLQGKLASGAALVGAWAHLDKHLEGADLVITGEGKLDLQSKDGKLISYILKAAQKEKVPVMALCGTLGLDTEGLEAMGLVFAQSILTKPSDLPAALKFTQEGLKLAAYSAFKLYNLGRSM